MHIIQTLKSNPIHHPCQYLKKSLRWRHNGRDSVSNHQPRDCLLNLLFRHRSKKTSKLGVTGLCVGNHRNRWIPCTYGQYRVTCFHLMTSSCITALPRSTLYYELRMDSWCSFIQSMNIRCPKYFRKSGPYHCCWWLCSVSSLGTSKHGIDYIYLVYHRLSQGWMWAASCLPIFSTDECKMYLPFIKWYFTKMLKNGPRNCFMLQRCQQTGACNYRES